MTAVVVSVDRLGVEFRRVRSRGGRARSAPGRLGWLLSEKESFWALADVSFEVATGEVLGVIGHNGAGKSTLLRVLTGVLPPDRGVVRVSGRVSALLALGAGFLPDLSGRENIFLSAMYLGMAEREIRAKYDDIVAFSELEDFIDTPIRHFSSGMKARLGFSLTTHVDPEVLIIDEVLAAGDREFQEKASRRMFELMASARAIVLVSHDAAFVRRLCHRVMWLDHGRVARIGPTAEVVDAYESGLVEAPAAVRAAAP